MAKVGAEGYLVVVAPSGATVALRSLDGAQRVTTFVALSLLARAGALDPDVVVTAARRADPGPARRRAGGRPLAAARLTPIPTPPDTEWRGHAMTRRQAWWVRSTPWARVSLSGNDATARPHAGTGPSDVSGGQLSSDSTRRLRVFFGSSGMLGPIVVATNALLM